MVIRKPGYTEASRGSSGSQSACLSWLLSQCGLWEKQGCSCVVGAASGICLATLESLTAHQCEKVHMAFVVGTGTCVLTPAEEITKRNESHMMLENSVDVAAFELLA